MSSGAKEHTERGDNGAEFVPELDADSANVLIDGESLPALLLWECPFNGFYEQAAFSLRQ
ncbi:MAG: hypothetical protein ABIO67_06275 [Mycobacteriales bacterium]